MGDKVKDCSPKKLNFLIKVPQVCQVKEHVFSFNMFLYHLRSVFLDRVVHFGETLGDQVKVPSPKKPESFIEVPNVVNVKVHALSFNMILI